MKALREHNFKIYFIIIFASLFVVLLGVKNYEDAKAQITALADKYRRKFLVLAGRATALAGARG